MGRAIWGNLALAIAATVGSLFVLEGFLRLTNAFGARVSWAQADSRVTWRFAPGSAYWRHDENEHPIGGRINSHGWRDRERELDPPDGTVRVAVLGDSFVEAMQVELDSTHLLLAERRLREATGRPWELMNFGRSGSTQSEQLLFLVDDVLEFRPDLVLLFFFPGNDIAEVRRETAPNPLRPFFHVDEAGELRLDTTFAESAGFRARHAIDGVKRRSALVSLMADRWNLLMRRPSEPKTEREMLRNTYLSLCTDTPSEAYRNSFDLNRRLIVEIARESRSAGADFALFTLDNPAYRTGVAERLREIDPSFDPRCFEGELQAVAEERGFAHIGLHSAFERSFRERAVGLHFGGNGHWNYDGHRVVADALFEFLVGWLEGQEPGSAESPTPVRSATEGS